MTSNPSVSVGCSIGGETCNVLVAMQLASGQNPHASAKAQTIGRGTAVIQPGNTRKVAVKVTAAGRAKLRRAGSLKVRVVVTVRSGTSVATTRKTTTLVRSRRRR